MRPSVSKGLGHRPDMTGCCAAPREKSRKFRGLEDLCGMFEGRVGLKTPCSSISHGSARKMTDMINVFGCDSCRKSGHNEMSR